MAPPTPAVPALSGRRALAVLASLAVPLRGSSALDLPPAQPWKTQDDPTVAAAAGAAAELAGAGSGQVLRMQAATAAPVATPPVRLFITAPEGLPVVIMHGMGDFGSNPMGMIHIRNRLANLTGNHAVSVELCSEPSKLKGCAAEDQRNGFLMTMDDMVDQFARVVRADPLLAGGFNAMGLSQGNTVIRGYIHRYNDPPVRSFISMHGVLMGVAGLPHCSMDTVVLSTICSLVNWLAEQGVETSFVQDHLAQANYFRDPMAIDGFRENVHFLPYINNEAPGHMNKTYTSNFESLEKLVLVMAEDDTMIKPKESEWFGYFKDGSTEELVAMENASWYTENWFGLRTLGEADKIVKYSTPGDHLEFSMKFLEEVVTKYFTGGPKANFAVPQLLQV